MTPIPAVLTPIQYVLTPVAPILRTIPDVLAPVTNVLQAIPQATVMTGIAAILGAIKPVFPLIDHVLTPVTSILAPIADVFDPVTDHRTAHRSLREQRCCGNQAEHRDDGQRIQSQSGRTHNDPPPSFHVAWLVVRPGLQWRRRQNARVKRPGCYRRCGVIASVHH